jgi:hypothetical protein
MSHYDALRVHALSPACRKSIVGADCHGAERTFNRSAAMLPTSANGT